MFPIIHKTKIQNWHVGVALTSTWLMGEYGDSQRLWVSDLCASFPIKSMEEKEEIDWPFREIGRTTKSGPLSVGNLN